MSLTIDFKKDFAIEKIFCFAWGLALVLPFSFETGFTIMIVTSYGHYMLSHMYQCKKKMPSKPLLLSVAAIFFALLLFSHEYFIAASLIPIPLTWLHCLWDEFKLLGEDSNALSGLVVFSIVTAQTIWLMDDLFSRYDFTPYLTAWLIGSSALMAGSCIYLYFKNALTLTTNIILFSLGHALFVFCYSQGYALHAFPTFWVILHYHGMSYYIHFMKRFYKTDKRKMKIFIQDIVIVWTIFVGGYFLQLHWPDTFYFMNYFFYSLGGYLAWSMLHLITTFRLSEYKNMLYLPKTIT